MILHINDNPWSLGGDHTDEVAPSDSLASIPTLARARRSVTRL